jgi:hypothetical protein
MDRSIMRSLSSSNWRRTPSRRCSSRCARGQRHRAARQVEGVATAVEVGQGQHGVGVVARDSDPVQQAGEVAAVLAVDRVGEGAVMRHRDARLVEDAAHEAGVADLDAGRQPHDPHRFARQVDQLGIGPSVGDADQLDADLGELAGAGELRVDRVPDGAGVLVPQRPRDSAGDVGVRQPHQLRQRRGEVGAQRQHPAVAIAELERLRGAGVLGS